MKLTKNTSVFLVIVGALFFADGLIHAGDVVQRWVARYNGPGNGEDHGMAIALDGSGNIYVTGLSAGNGTGYDYATIKYDPNSNQKWVARYNGPPGNGNDSGQAVALDGSGNIYVTGFSTGSGTGYDYATIKYDPNGNEKWVARYNGPGNGDDYTYVIAVDGSGNIYVTGFSTGSGTGYDYVTIKYDPNGNQKWVARYNGPGNGNDYAYAIAVDGSGNIYVTGESIGSGTGYDYATIKYDPNGNQKWEARYNGPGNNIDVAWRIAVDVWGNIFVTGTSIGSGTGYDYATIKYDPNGNEKWVARYNGPVGNGEDNADAIALDGSGNIYIAGFSEGNGTSHGYSDYATIKYDPNGNQKWVARYNGPGNGEDYAYAIAVDGSGNIYVTGFSNGNGTGRDYATIKYDSSGNEVWVRRYNGPGNGADDQTAIAVDAWGNVYVTGRSIGSGTNYDYATIKYTVCKYTLAGDLNDDCEVDFYDVALLANSWLVNYEASDLQTLTTDWLIDCFKQPSNPACVPK